MNINGLILISSYVQFGHWPLELFTFHRYLHQQWYNIILLFLHQVLVNKVMISENLDAGQLYTQGQYKRKWPSLHILSQQKKSFATKNVAL